MGRTTQLRCVLVGVVAGLVAIAGATRPASAIEMFTYFGDGSRIGLPSLEVPIEAYPGIPLRSDRLRARRAGTAPPQGAVGQFRRRGITIRVPAQQSVPFARFSPEPMTSDSVTADDVEEEAKAGMETHGSATESRQPQPSFDFGGLRDLSAHEQSHSR